MIKITFKEVPNGAAFYSPQSASWDIKNRRCGYYLRTCRCHCIWLYMQDSDEVYVMQSDLQVQS